MDTVGGGASARSIRLLMHAMASWRQAMGAHATFYLPPIFSLVVFQAKRSRSIASPLFAKFWVGRQAAGREPMKAKNTSGILISESNKGMLHLDKAQVCFEKVQYEIVTRGIQDYPLYMRPRQREQVCRFQVSFKDDGYTSITVDELNPLDAPPVLGKLAHYLASQAGSVKPDKEDDPFVPFKDIGEIVAHMTSSEKEFTRGALKQAIHRLRRLLASNGCRDILQSHRPKRAYRIRLRQKKFCDLAKPNTVLMGGAGGSNPPSPAQGLDYER